MLPAGMQTQKLDIFQIKKFEYKCKTRFSTIKKKEKMAANILNSHNFINLIIYLDRK